MVTGKLAIVVFRCVLKNWLLSAVNSSGAVSPAYASGGEQDAGNDAGSGRAVSNVPDHE